MASTYTTNKKLEQPANNDYVGNWNLPVNADWSTIDTCFGGYQVLNPTGQSGTVALTSSTSGTQPYTTTAQWQAPNIVIGTSLSGVATLTANVNYQLPSGIGGIWSIFNNTTGAFTVTFSSAGGGSSVVLPQGYRIKVVSDGTNVQVAQTSSTNFGLSGALRFLGSTTGYMGFQGPATGNNTTWTLPGTDGSSGQVLSTNGSAVLSWASVASTASALTAGSVLFGNASGQIAQDNAKFYWDDTNYRLGIGVSSPSAILQVSGSGTNQINANDTTAAGGTITFGTGFNAVLDGQTAGVLRINRAGYTYVSMSGSVGINTLAPAGTLEAQAANASIISTGTAGYGSFYARGSGTNSAYLFMGNVTNGEQARITAVDTGILQFSNGNTATERMRITPTGLVGIGTNNPQRILDVEQSGVDYQFRLGDAGGSNYYDIGRVTANGLLTFYGSQAAASGYVFSTVNGERMRIDTSGNMGVGTSSPGSYGRLAVSSAAGVGTIYALGNNISTVTPVLTVSDSNNSNGANVLFIGNGGTTPQKYLRASGGLIQWINNAYSAVIWQMDDGGNVNNYGDIYFANSTQAPASQYSLGFRGLPQNNAGGATYTAVLSDAGKSLIIGNGQTFTIPANASVAYPVGTTLTIINGSTGAGQNATIAITSDTLYQANTTGTTGSRTLAPLGIATAIKYSATVWVISGVGLS